MAPVFDGSTTKKRHISLGGRRKDEPSTQRALIESAREARERRAAQRATATATATAQRFRRGAREVRRAKAAVREAYANASEGVMVDDASCRALVYFGDGWRDWAACAAACERLYAAATTTTSVAPSEAFVERWEEAMRASGVERARWVIRMRKMVRLIVGSLRATTRLEETTGRDVAETHLASALLALMARDDARWKDTGVQLCATLCSNDGLEDVREILLDILRNQSRRDDVVRAAMLRTCENIARCSGDDASGALASMLATIPGVWDTFGPEIHSRDLWSFVVDAFKSDRHVDSVATVALETPLSGVDAALGNVLQLTKTFIGTMDFSQSQNVVVAVTKLMESSVLSGALFATTPNAMEDEDDDEGGADDDDDDDDSVKIDLLNLRAVRAEARKIRRVPPDVDMEAVRATRTWMQTREFFGDNACVARLVTTIMPANDAQRCLVGIEGFTHFACACDMVLRGAERASFTRVLTFGTDCIAQLWPALEHWRQTSGGGQERSFRRALGVFAKLYNTYTAISDDEEFYRLGKPLGLEATTRLVAFLRDTLWTLLWVERGPDGTPLNALSFIDEYFEAETWHACSIALARLHDRNGRHQFMNPLEFQVRDAQVDIPTLLQEARDAKSRASMLLCGAPCLVPFEVRVHKFMDVRRRERQMGAVGYATIRVRRGHLLEDGIAGLSDKLTETLGGIIRVQFINQQGLEEAGVDGGGLFKDFLNDLIAEAFDPKFGLFVETPERTLYPNPASELHAGERHLQYFYFLGAILGKACYDGILLDVPLADFFLASLKGRHVEFNDLTTLDPELYRNLVSLKRYQGDVEDLCLYFTAIDRSGMEETVIELIPNGSSVPVTRANVPRYLHCMSIYLLRAQIYRQLSSMKAGFSIAVRKRWLDMFTPAELRLLISGNRTGSMDIDDMAANCEYSGGYEASHPTIRALWRVMRTISPDDQRLVLKFITSCSNTPLLGFSHLEPKLCVHRSGTAGTDAPDATADLTRLPTAATCMNLLKLPPYSSDDALREKLMYAVKSGSGFDLS